jgi:CRP/FNR family cyclic AMP-dependent transcriptional regulator
MKQHRKGISIRSEIFDSADAGAESRQYANGEVIFQQGDAANAMFRVEKGYVKLAVASKRSTKSAIGILRVGECFGEGCLTGKSRRPYTATSINRSTVQSMGKQAIGKRLREEPAFAQRLVAHLLRRITRVEEDLADQLVSSSEKRLARVLLQLSDFEKLSGSLSEEVMVDQATLAAVVGTTRSRVSHFMNEFRKKGFIDYNGTLQVHQELLTFLLGEERAS